MANLWTSKGAGAMKNHRPLNRIQIAHLENFTPERPSTIPKRRKVLNVARTLCRVPVWKML